MTPERKARIHDVLNNRQPDLTVVMENVGDPHNIFAVMRTCESVGIQDIYILNTIMTGHKKLGQGSSSGASGWLSIHTFEDINECIAALRKKNFRLFATHLGSSSKSLYELDLVQPAALVFGNEQKGLSKEMLAHCDGNFIIPQVGMSRSLNISVACSVTLYEAFRQRQLSGCYNNVTKLPSAEYETLVKEWSAKSA